MYFVRLPVSLFFITFFVARIESEEIECKAGHNTLAICKRGIKGSSVSVRRIEAEDPTRTCNEGNQYKYVIHKPYLENEVWIYVHCGCGGKFEMTENAQPTWNSWTAWSACSVSCGSGQRERTRTCSTGDSSECSNGSDDKESKTCNRGSCDKRKENLKNICGKPFSLPYRILGGQEAKHCEYPWMVMLYNRRAHSFCGGSIIDENRILTAAHCVKPKFYSAKASDFVVFSGANLMPFTKSYKCIEGLKLRYVSKIKAHEHFDSNYLTHDVAVLTLTEPIVFDTCHMPICLPSTSPSSISGCKVTGWGKTSSGIYAAISSRLLYTELDVVDPSNCEEQYQSSYFKRERQICAGGNGHGSCKGDSGGPLICPGSDGQYFQYGIVSGGAVGQCGETPGIYTKVSNYYSWINTNDTGDNEVALDLDELIRRLLSGDY